MKLSAFYNFFIFTLNPFAAVVTSYLVVRKLVAVCPYDEYIQHESHSSNA